MSDWQAGKVPPLGEEVGPGLRRWTAFHEEWGERVAALAVDRDDELVLVDPLLDGAAWDSLATTAVARRLHVVLTVHYHARSAGEIAERFPSTKVWAYEPDRRPAGRRAPVTDLFAAGERLPAGLRAFSGHPRREAFLWNERARAVICGDLLLGDGNRGDGLHLCPEGWLPEGSGGHAALRESVRVLLELPVEMVLPSHGAPVLTDGLAALREAVVDR